MSLIADMQLRGVWAAFVRYVLTLEPILLTTTRRGLPISVTRHAEVTAEFEAELTQLYTQMQTLVPDDVKTLKVCKKKPSYRLPFKPSNQALVRYMRFRGHPVPKSWKTEKDTTAQDELGRLEKSTGDPLYRCVREYRDAQTVLRNHLKNWRPCER